MDGPAPFVCPPAVPRHLRGGSRGLALVLPLGVQEPMRTDIHTHIFHPRIAGRAVEYLETYYHIHCQGTGTLVDLRQRAARAGMERCVVSCAATAPAQVIPVNRHAVEVQEHTPGVLALGTIHPGCADWEGQLHWLREHHIQGVKLHPDFQGFWLDDPRLEPILECAAALKLVCLFHIGDAKAPQESPSCPYKLAAILDKFPPLTVIAAHMGGYRQWEHAEKALIGRDVWLDTSSSADFLEPATLRRLLNAHDPGRLLFGSDYPLYDPLDALRLLQTRGGLDDARMERLLHNADKLLASVPHPTKDDAHVIPVSR